MLNIYSLTDLQVCFIQECAHHIDWARICHTIMLQHEKIPGTSSDAQQLCIHSLLVIIVVCGYFSLVSC